MKIIKIIFFLSFFSGCFAQPGKPFNLINIETIYINNKQIFKDDNTKYLSNTIILTNNKGEESIWTNTVTKYVLNYKNFIYKNDTMRVKFIATPFSALSNIEIKKFNFIKGNFTIDLFQYIKDKHDIKNNILIINNFPEDCLPYRKEEKE